MFVGGFFRRPGWIVMMLPKVNANNKKRLIVFASIDELSSKGIRLVDFKSSDSQSTPGH